MKAWYYLHENGSLIVKRTPVEVEPGGFVKKVWEIDTEDRLDAWRLCIEAPIAGADPTRVKELASKWGLTDADAQEFAKRTGLVLYRDGDSWCAAFSGSKDLVEEPHGFGDTALGAFIDLVRNTDARTTENGV